jgi:formylglycine-generating enzyme required for sulfatase activity
LDAYWIDQTEVTNKQYATCEASGACTPPSDSSSETNTSYYGSSKFDDYPVIYVDWNQAQAYCEWAGRRLPTEAEWEKAARGVDGKTYPWGENEPTANLLNLDMNVGDTTFVGNYPQGVSPYGAQDMAGNVWEWVNDWYDKTYYKKSPVSNPAGASSGEIRVLRGGSWADGGTDVRSSARLEYSPDVTSFIFGFRCSRSQ